MISLTTSPKQTALIQKRDRSTRAIVVVGFTLILLVLFVTNRRRFCSSNVTNHDTIRSDGQTQVFSSFSSISSSKKILDTNDGDDNNDKRKRINKDRNKYNLLNHNNNKIVSEAKEFWYHQQIDHFDFNNNNTFKQRVFIFDKFWEQPNGPILFYCGNEADVTLYLNHTGLMWENAKDLKALLLFAEHRYYGQSIIDAAAIRNTAIITMKNDDNDNKDKKKKFDMDRNPKDKGIEKKTSTMIMKYLTHEQALADYAELTNYFKNIHYGKLYNKYSPVIAIGGSYGGMLAAWFRMTYPNVIHGAIAASSPIFAFSDGYGYNGTSYWQVVTKDFEIGGLQQQKLSSLQLGKEITSVSVSNSTSYCVSNIRRVWSIIFRLAEHADGKKRLIQNLKLCSNENNNSIMSGEDLGYYLMMAFDTMAMGNYPYPSSYLTNGNGTLPAWPVHAACSYLEKDFFSQEKFIDKGMSTVAEDEVTEIQDTLEIKTRKDIVKQEEEEDELLRAIASAVGVYTNATGEVSCYDVPTKMIDYDGSNWDYQWCTELMPQESYFDSNGQTDMFWPRNISIDDIRSRCQKVWDGLSPRPNWIRTMYGDERLTGTSNVVFSNGNLDPWSSGSVQFLDKKYATKNSIKIVTIPEGAHHLDLFFAHPDDPDSVIVARNTEIQYIKRWIRYAYDNYNKMKTIK